MRSNGGGRVMRLVGVSLAVVVVSITGCAVFQSNVPMGQPPAASPRQHPVLANIPLPMGFRLVPERSVARLAGKLRVAQCEFEGPGAVDDVADFFSQYMPSARFALRSKRFDNGEYLLRFESDAEECNIRVKPRFGGAIVVIDLGPLARSSADSESAPPPTRQPGS